MFILRIFFSGLIAFIPGKEGKELTVLLLNTPHAHHATTRSGIPEHKPVLLARAAGCAPGCPKIDVSVAKFLYPGISDAEAVDSLAKAVDRGLVLELAGSNLSFGIPNDGVKLMRTVSPGKSVPDTDAERADFGWVASLKKIDPAMIGLHPSVFSENPPEELIVARFTLTSGEVSTRSLIQIGDRVMPIDFRPLSGDGKSYTRAAASWVQAEIHVPGDSLKIVEERFSGGGRREVSLKPLNGVIEMAILNVSEPVRRKEGKPRAGLHFARFWDLAVRPPAKNRRPVPQVPRSRVPTRSSDALHSDPARRSDLLEAVFPGDRSPYDQLLCPMSQYP
jgi:hypothetical protein